MKHKNRYYFRSKISESKFRQIIRFFSMDFTATNVAKLKGISVRFINPIVIKIRKIIAVECEKRHLSKALWNLMNLTLLLVVYVEKEVVVLQVKQSFLDDLNVKETSIPK